MVAPYEAQRNAGSMYPPTTTTPAGLNALELPLFDPIRVDGILGSSYHELRAIGLTRG